MSQKNYSWILLDLCGPSLIILDHMNLFFCQKWKNGRLNNKSQDVFYEQYLQFISKVIDPLFLIIKYLSTYLLPYLLGLSNLRKFLNQDLVCSFHFCLCSFYQSCGSAAGQSCYAKSSLLSVGNLIFKTVINCRFNNKQLVKLKHQHKKGSLNYEIVVHHFLLHFYELMRNNRTSHPEAFS